MGGREPPGRLIVFVCVPGRLGLGRPAGPLPAHMGTSAHIPSTPHTRDSGTAVAGVRLVGT